jgi:hypothetical protein
MREKTERWMELAKQAAVEQDPAKMLELIKEINDLLLEKEHRLVREHKEIQSSPLPPKTDD